MSRQSENKDRQEWRKKGPTCADCVAFRKLTHGYGEWKKETNIHCAIGEFTTGKSCWCKEYEKKEGIGG